FFDFPLYYVDEEWFEPLCNLEHLVGSHGKIHTFE
ncbi:unnamed protein product, partial [marine sediment metagenome]